MTMAARSATVSARVSLRMTRVTRGAWGALPMLLSSGRRARRAGVDDLTAVPEDSPATCEPTRPTGGRGRTGLGRAWGHTRKCLGGRGRGEGCHGSSGLSADSAIFTSYGPADDRPGGVEKPAAFAAGSSVRPVSGRLEAGALSVAVGQPVPAVDVAPWVDAVGRRGPRPSMPDLDMGMWTRRAARHSDGPDHGLLAGHGPALDGQDPAQVVVG